MEREIKPSDLVKWEQVDQTKVREEDLNFHPWNYAWFLLNGVYIPNRKPTVNEILSDTFL